MALAEPVSPGLRKRRDVTIAGNDRLHEAHAGALHKRYAKQNDHVGTRLSDTAALVLTPRLRAAAVDVALSTALLVLAVAVRFYRLTYVDGIIFDEVHYAKFTNWILTRRFFFDVHPVFGKWIIAVIARALGFDPHADSFQGIGTKFSSPWQAFAARTPAALFGSLTVPVFYCVCRQLRLSRASSFLGASFILFDMMHAIQSRLVMVDSVLVFFTCAAALSALLMWDVKLTVQRNKHDAVRSHQHVAVWALIVITGVLAGLSISVRWTAFATPAFILIVSTFGIPPFCAAPMSIAEVFVMAASMFAAYYASFAVFLLTLDTSGTGDAFMSAEFQACLRRATPGEQPALQCSMSLWRRFVELNRKIFVYSKGIRGSDRWGSSWFQWIVNWRGALYYRHQDKDDTGRVWSEALVYVLMNPAMVAVVDLLMALFGSVLVYVIRYRSILIVDDPTMQQLRRGTVLLFGWMGSMLPTMVVYRSGPVYQYLPGLFFAQALAALSFDLIVPDVARGSVVSVIASLLVVAFVYWSPWVYGTSLTLEQHASRRWMPTWD